MSSILGGGFKGSKCKTLLRLAMARIKLLRNKRDIQIKQMRKDIAQLLSTGQEPSARIRVEHIAREQNITAAYDVIELFCELIIVRLPIIESQKLCPMDLKEAVSSLIFASPRCADLPELLQIRSLFASKYGKEFVAAAAELRPECGVNRRVIEKLSVRAPSGETKLKLLTEIAEEHNVNWDPTNSELELLKQPEDLLDGPKKFFGPSQVPIPEPPTQHHELVSRASDISPLPPPTPPDPSVAQQYSHHRSSSGSDKGSPSGDKKQFIPFVNPPPSRAPLIEELESPPKVTTGPSFEKGSNSGHLGLFKESHRRVGEGHTRYEKHREYVDVAAAARAAADSADRAVAAARAAAELASSHASRRGSLSRKVVQDSESSPEESEVEQDLERDWEAVTQEKSAASFRAAGSKLYREQSDVSSKKILLDARNEVPLKTHSDYVKEDSFKRSSQDDIQGTFSGRNRTDEVDDNPPRRFNQEESFWRSGDQDWRGVSHLNPERKIDLDEFYSGQGDGHGSTKWRGSDLFNRAVESEEAIPSRSKDSNAGTSKFSSSSDSGGSLLERNNLEELESRSSDGTSVYDTKPELSTPKFDEDEMLYSKTSVFTNVTDDLSFRRNLDIPKLKPTFDEWRSLSHKSEDEERSFGNDDHGSEKRWPDSYNIFDTRVEGLRDHAGSRIDFPPIRSSFKEDPHTSKQEDNEEPSSPILTKSRRTRKPVEKLEVPGVGGDGGGGIVPGGKPLFPGVGNVDSLARSSGFHSPSGPDTPSVLRYDDSVGTSRFARSPKASAPIAPPALATSSAYKSPDAGHDLSPSMIAGSPSFTSSLRSDRRDFPSTGSIHPRLPDYDDLTARFEALKGKARR